MQPIHPYTLTETNLVPIYILEEPLKQNFKTVASFIQHSITNQQSVAGQIKAITEANAKGQLQLQLKLKEAEAAVIKNVTSDLDVKIESVIAQRIASLVARIQKIEKRQSTTSQQNASQVEMIRRSVMAETAKSCSQIVRQVQRREGSVRLKSGQESKSAGTGDSSVQVSELSQRITHVQEYLVTFDKRFYENQGALKASWKELVEQLNENRKALSMRVDQLKLEVAKIKNHQQFGKFPEQAKEIMRGALEDKLNNLQRIIVQAVPRSEFEWAMKHAKELKDRHDEEIADVKAQQARNNDYFTFYAANNDREDLDGRIHKLETVNEQIAKEAQTARISLKQAMQALSIFTEEVKSDNRLGLTQQELKQTQVKMEGLLPRIKKLQDQYNLTPDKLEVIHSALDSDLTFSEMQLIEKKEKSMVSAQISRQIKGDIARLKDELFVLTHSQREAQGNFARIEKQFASLEAKIDRSKLEAEESSLTRKPWVCLSCDRNGVQEKKDNLKRRVSQVKISISSKMMKGNERDAEAHERFKDKYLGVAVKLPEIFKQKVGQKIDP